MKDEMVVDWQRKKRESRMEQGERGCDRGGRVGGGGGGGEKAIESRYGIRSKEDIVDEKQEDEEKE